jgi:V/A-type H+-transporting ATPase subunit E
MGLEKIKEEIQQKAEAVAEAVLREAERRAKGIRDEAEREMARLQAETDARLSREPQILEKREAALRESVSSRMLLEAKKDILDEVYQRAYRKITEMPKEDRRRLIAALLSKAQQEIDVARIYVNDVDGAFLNASIETKPLRTDGGIICETADGRVRVDYRFSTLFENVREPTIHRTSQILFA